MTGYAFVLASAFTLLTASAQAAERNYTLRGRGYFDPAGRGFRVPLQEVRLTLRDNGYFAATLFTRGERLLVRGQWDRRGNGNSDRITLEQAFGISADGRGTLQYTGGNRRQPQRLTLEGRTRDGGFHATIDTEGDGWDGNDRDNGRSDRGREDERGRGDLGRGNRLYREIDAVTNGHGVARMSRIRDGNFAIARVQMGTGRDVRIDIDRTTKGTIRGELVDVMDDRIKVRVTDVFGYRATGELVVQMRNATDVRRINGFGKSDGGSWQIDFDGNGRADERWVWDNPGSGRDESRPGFAELDVNERGRGYLRQDVGPEVTFDQVRVTLDRNRQATITLQGRRQTIKVLGRWTSDGDDATVDISQINEMNARGQLTIRRTAWGVTLVEGDGRTDRGRFEFRFTR